MIRPFLDVNLPPNHALFNSGICWTSYKDLKQQWISQNFARNLKLRQAPISILYKASALLWNFRICMYSGTFSAKASSKADFDWVFLRRESLSFFSSSNCFSWRSSSLSYVDPTPRVSFSYLLWAPRIFLWTRSLTTICKSFVSLFWFFARTSATSGGHSLYLFPSFV